MNTELTQTDNGNGGNAVAENHPQQRYVRKPHYSVGETENGYSVRVELPGVRREDVDLNVEDHVLTVQAERKADYPSDWKPLRAVLPHYDFRLRLALSKDVNTAEVKASLDDGILNLDLPKAEEAKPRRIEVS